MLTHGHTQGTCSWEVLRNATPTTRPGYSHSQTQTCRAAVSAVWSETGQVFPDKQTNFKLSYMLSGHIIRNTLHSLVYCNSMQQLCHVFKLYKVYHVPMKIWKFKFAVEVIDKDMYCATFYWEVLITFYPLCVYEVLRIFETLTMMQSSTTTNCDLNPMAQWVSLWISKVSTFSGLH